MRNRRRQARGNPGEATSSRYNHTHTPAYTQCNLTHPPTPIRDCNNDGGPRHAVTLTRHTRTCICLPDLATLLSLRLPPPPPCLYDRLMVQDAVKTSTITRIPYTTDYSRQVYKPVPLARLLSGTGGGRVTEPKCVTPTTT